MFYGRLTHREDRDAKKTTPDVDNPKYVARHDCDGQELLRRHRDEAARFVREGRQGIERVAPYLWERLVDTRTLRQAWDYLSEYGGQSPGPCGYTYADFDEYQIWPFLRSIRDDLIAGTYCPGPERVIAISKGPGRGTRSLVIQDIADRILQRAVMEISQPLLAPIFDSRSFGFQPNRGTLHALVHATKLFQAERRKIWVTQDVRDAFAKVPLGRLLQLVHKYLVSDKLTDLIGRIVGDATTPGLRQGGSLSPLLLNLYLHHHLDVPWRKRHPDIPLLRYADDLLLMCLTVKEARMAHDSLSELLRPAGMPLKCDRRSAVRKLKPESPAEWLGFTIDNHNGKLRVAVGQRAWERLDDELALAAEEPFPDRHARLVLNGWLSAMGPAYRHIDHQAAYQRLVAAAGDVSLPPAANVKASWQRAHARWCKLLRSTTVPQPPPTRSTGKRTPLHAQPVSGDF